jgi:hypothetical protein
MDDEYLDDMVLEPEDIDLDDPRDFDFDEPENVDLDELEDINSDELESNNTDNNDNNDNNSFQSSALSQTSGQVLVKKQKKVERPGGSPVKVFYEIRLINNLEFWVCRHKSCISRTKYLKDGSTSNLWRHLRNKHHISRAMVEVGRVKVVVKNNNHCEFSVMPESSQSTIMQSFNKVKKYLFDNPKQKKLDNNIAAFIIEELQPFSIIQSQSFKRIIEGLDTQANILSNDRLKEILINSEDKILQNLREYALDSAEISYISFTTDMWTSSNGDPYIGLTLHWINDSFQVKEITGNISYLPYPHTSNCLLNKIVEILDNLKIKHLTVSGTVDNGSNIKLCLEKLEQKYGIYKVHCFGHTLQLAINDALKECSEITSLIKKCKDIVSHFSGSPKQKQFLLEAQMEIEDWNKFLFVVRDVSTRWNSTFYLLKRLTILKPAMYKYKSFLAELRDNSSLKSYEEKELSSDEWEKVTELVKLLYPYECISKKLSGSQYPTLSQAWFAINFIKTKLNCAITIINNNDIQKFGSLLCESLQERFLEPTKPIRLAAFFDPRAKDMQIFTEKEKQQTISEARMEYLELATIYYEGNNLSDTASSDIIHGEDIFSNSPASCFQENSNQNDNDITNREFNSYLLLPRVPSEIDILQWWASRKSDYPILAKLARKYLSIPATSVPSERLFSSAGLTITEKRTCLNSQFVESILLLKSALKLWPISHVFN